MVKVFRDAKPADSTQAIAEVARGEHATLQIVVRSDEPIKHLHVEVGPLVLQTDESRLLNQALVRFVGYVPVDRPIPKPPNDQLRKPPADFPDPLLEKRLIRIRTTQRRLVAAPESVVDMLECIASEACEKLVALKSNDNTGV